MCLKALYAGYFGRGEEPRVGKSSSRTNQNSILPFAGFIHLHTAAELLCKLECMSLLMSLVEHHAREVTKILDDHLRHSVN